MNEDNNMTESLEVEKKERINYKELYEKTQSELQAIARKKDELLNEKKQESEKRRQAEAQAEVEKAEKAKKNGDYESLLKSAEAQRQEWEHKYKTLTDNLTKKEIRSKAIQMANELKPLDGDAAETLADYIEKRIKLNDNSMIFLDKDGNPSVMDADTLKNEFKTSNKFRPLLKGSEATGGGAPGANGSANTGMREITRSDYDRLKPSEQLEYSKLVQKGVAKAPQ